MKSRTLIAVAILAGWAVYAKVLRQPILTWGATADEAVARLPGDELLEEADGIATDCDSVSVWLLP